MIIDIDYIVENNKPIIRIWNLTNDGIKLTIDDTFEPYFYAYNERLGLLKNKVENIKIKRKDSTISPTKIEFINKKIFGKEKEVLKIYTQLPSHVPIIRNYIKHNIEDTQLFECDILFPTRYLICKGLKLYEV